MPFDATTFPASNVKQPNHDASPTDRLDEPIAHSATQARDSSLKPGKQFNASTQKHMNKEVLPANATFRSGSQTLKLNLDGNKLWQGQSWKSTPANRVGLPYSENKASSPRFPFVLKAQIFSLLLQFLFSSLKFGPSIRLTLDAPHVLPLDLYRNPTPHPGTVSGRVHKTYSRFA